MEWKDIKLDVFNKVDYKELLLKYIKHVEECEGTNFLDTTSYIIFTEQELKELELLSKNV